MLTIVVIVLVYRGDDAVIIKVGYQVAPVPAVWIEKFLEVVIVPGCSKRNLQNV